MSIFDDYEKKVDEDGPPTKELPLPGGRKSTPAQPTPLQPRLPGSGLEMEVERYLDIPLPRFERDTQDGSTGELSYRKGNL